MSLLRPQPDYASSVWDSYHQGEIHEIQRHAARFVGRDYRCEVGIISNLLPKLNWSTLQERRKAARLLLLYKIVNKHLAVDTGRLLKIPAYNRSNTTDLINITNIPSFLEQ